MKKQSLDTILHELDTWFETDLGQELHATEEKIVSNLLSQLFGYHLLHIGPKSTFKYTKSSRINHCIQLQREFSNDFTQYSLLPALPEQLPIREDSVDVVSLIHTLEFTKDPHEVLREIYRVLIPEGYVIIIGFNPFSLFGAFQSVTRKKQAPWSGDLLHLTRLKDWLALLGFEQRVIECDYFIPPFANTKLRNRFKFMANFTRKCFPFTGSFYIILAQKRLSTLTPIRPRWRSRRQLVSEGVMNPTPRSINNDE